MKMSERLDAETLKHERAKPIDYFRMSSAQLYELRGEKNKNLFLGDDGEYYWRKIKIVVVNLVH